MELDKQTGVYKRCRRRLNGVDVYSTFIEVVGIPDAMAWGLSGFSRDAGVKGRMEELCKRFDSMNEGGELLKMYIPLKFVKTVGGMLEDSLKGRAEYLLVTKSLYLYMNYESAEKNALSYMRRTYGKFAGIYDISTILKKYKCLDVWDVLDENAGVRTTQKWNEYAMRIEDIG